MFHRPKETLADAAGCPPPPQHSHQSIALGKLPALPVPRSNTYARPVNSPFAVPRPALGPRRDPGSGASTWVQDTAPLASAKCTAAPQRGGPGGAPSGTAGCGDRTSTHQGQASPRTAPWGCNGVNRSPGNCWWFLRHGGVGETRQTWRWLGQQRAAVATRELSEFRPHGSLVWKPFSPGTRGKLQLMAVSNQSGPAGVGRTPMGSSGNVKNEFNQVSLPFEEAIKIKGGHTSTAFPVPVTAFCASSWNTFSI